VIVSPVDDAYFIRLGAHGDTELEVWAAQRHVAPLEQVLGRPVRFELLGQSAPPTSTPPGDLPQDPASDSETSDQ
jgi:hypothetical protein